MKLFRASRSIFGWWVVAACLLAGGLPSACAQSAAGTALRFDGVDDYVEVPHDAALNAYPLTITAWVKTLRNSSQVDGIVSKYFDGSFNGYSLNLRNGNLYVWYLRSGGSVVVLPNGLDGGFIADGHWHHIAFVVSPTSGQVYVDGNLRNSVGWTGTPGPPTGTEPLQIGRYFNYGNTFQGEIDEVELWNRSLSASELNYLKHRRLGGTEDGLLGYWRFDESSGTVANNTATNAFHGTLLNAPARVASHAAIALEPVAVSAVKLDGVNDFVTVPHNTDLNPYPFTATTWFRTTNGGNVVQGLVTKSVDTGNGWSLIVQSGRLRSFYYRSFANFAVDATSAASVADGAWHHAALTVDASGGKVFLDGVLVGSSAWTGPAGAVTLPDPLQIGRYFNYTTPLMGAMDEVTVWNRALTAGEILSMKNLPLAGSESGLVAYWRFDDAMGTTAADATGLGHTGTLTNGAAWTGSTAYLGDGSVHLVAAPSVPNFTRLHAINSAGGVAPAAGQGAFQVNGRGFLRRFYDFGSAPASVALVNHLDATLQVSSSSTPVAVKPNTVTSTFSMSAYNASTPQPVFFGAVASISSTVNVEPDGPQLDSVNNLHEAIVTLTHSEDGGGFVDDGNDTTGAAKLLHFNGTLFFGDIPTTFNSFANTPTPGVSSAPDFLQTQLQLPAGAGRLLNRPEVTFGGGAAINVTLAVDGTATNLNGTYTIANPTPFVTAGIRAQIFGSLTPSGALATFYYAYLPTGLGVQIDPEIRAQYPFLVARNIPLDPFLLPTTDPVVFTPDGLLPGATTFYFAEETKPVLFASPSIDWNVAVGQFNIPEATTLTFVRQSEDDALTARKALLRNPPAADRVSNDSYYRNASALPGVPIVIRADPVNGSARMQMQLALNPAEVRPHFPYTGPDHSGPVPSAGGYLNIVDDLIDTASSVLLLGDVVPVPYKRDCSDTNCAGASLPALVLPFTPAPSLQLGFTPDGGLLGFGSVPAQNLTWGYTGTPDQFAHRTSDVEAGAYHMPGTFLRGDVPASADAVRPAVLLFTGFGAAADPNYVERPGPGAYEDGFANYAGLNFRGPIQGRSRLAGQDTGVYPLVPEAKYYARFGGVSGLHQASSFPGSLRLSGYDMTFSRFALSFLDSDNWESRTDGRITFPEQPSGFFLDFERMKFLCRGSLADAQLPPNTPEKHLNYWNTDFQPLSMEFREATNRPCAIDERFLVLGVQTKLPFIPEALHASLAFWPSGNLGTPRDGIRGVDSRFPVPGQLSLQGSGGSFFKINTANEGYFNNWETPGRPPEGFYNLAGRIDLPFFEDSKVHLHITPLTTTASKIDIMGGWRAADQSGPNYGWKINTNHFFNTKKFDDTHRGFPERSVDGSRAITIGEYRKSGGLDFHPRAQRDWIEVAIFDYPLIWDPTLRQFASFADSKVILPIIDVDSRLKELSPGKVDLDFAQDLDLKLPRIKLLDLANDAVNEINGPLNSLSNVIRSAFTDLTDSTGLTKGFRSMQRALRDQVDGFFRPVLEGALDPVGGGVVDALYTKLSAELATNPANFSNRVASIVNDPLNGLQNAIRGINGVASQANSVAGQLNGTLNDVDDTLNLFIRILEKGGDGKRHVVQAILQKLAEDQGPALGIVGSIADPIASELLKELEPTLAKVQDRLNEVRSELNKARGQLDGVTGDFSKALGTVTGNGTAVSDYMRLAGSSMSNLMATAITPARDYFTANPLAAKRAIRERLIVAFLSSQMASKYQQTFKQFLYDDDVIVNQLTETLFQQINQSIRSAIDSKLDSGVYSAMKGIGMLSKSLGSAKIRGAPTFNGDALKKIRLDAKVKMSLPDDFDFTAYMEIRELDSQSVALDCIPSGAPAAEIILGAADVPLKWPGVSASGVPLTLTVEARWTQQSGNVLGVGGMILIKGEAGFKGCTVKEIGATLAVGELEAYFAAKAAGTIIILGVPVDVQAGLFAGKSCTLTPIVFVDPEAGKVLGDPLGFTGVYVQFGGGLSLSEILFGVSNCFLDANATVSTAVYYQAGPSSGKLGMRQKLALDLRLLCLIEGHADLTMFASAEFGSEGYVLILGGEANVCGELGYCPFCIEGCAGVSIRGEVRDGKIDYHLD